MKNKMLNATISADIVSSTSLNVEELTLLQAEIRHFLDELSKNSQGSDWGRLFKGDSVEIFLLDPRKALRIALLLKALVKKAPVSLKSNKNAKRILFRKYGIRLAIGIGEMRIADQKNDILDGKAIYNSGRLLEGQQKTTKDKPSIKRSLFFGSNDAVLNAQMDVILGLLDAILKEMTTRQSEILYYKLLGANEEEIASKLSIKQSAVNQQSNSFSWPSIESAVNYFEKLNFEP
jgi:hypothetical protein